MTALESHLNSLPYYFYFLVVDKFLDISVPDLKNFTSISPTTLGISLDQQNSGRLLSHQKCLDYISQHTPAGFTPAIVTFKPSAKVDLLCRQHHWLQIGNPSQTNRLFEDKLKFAGILSQHSIPQIPHIITDFTVDNYQSAQKKFGQTLVVQTHFGWAGNSSYLSTDWDSLAEKITIGTPVKITPFLKGFSLINNCCLTSQGLISSPPGRQFTGISQLTQNPLATCGRHWPSHTNDIVNQQLANITSQFAKVLQDHHYLGYFGLDFFVSQEKVYLIECNPRLTASFAFYHQLEHQLKIDSLFYFHLLSFIPHQIDIDIPLQNQRSTNYDLVGSEIVLKNSVGTTIKKLNSPEDFSTPDNPDAISPQFLDQINL